MRTERIGNVYFVLDDQDKIVGHMSRGDTKLTIRRGQAFLSSAGDPFWSVFLDEYVGEATGPVEGLVMVVRALAAQKEIEDGRI